MKNSPPPFLTTFLLLFMFSCGNSFVRDETTTHAVVEGCGRSNLGPTDTFKKYLPDIEKAVDILSRDRTLILNTLSPRFRGEILAVGFPEVIRWNAFQDVVETTVDRLLYVKFGFKYGDFSVGMFQMRPSFIENLEMCCRENLSTDPQKRFNDFLLTNKDEVVNRSIRLKRLEERVWQLKYLQLYWLVATHKFSHVNFKNKEQRIKFYSTAYNYGFTRPISEILAWQSRKQFPFGKNYPGQQIAYSDVSITFLNTYSAQLFSPFNV